MYTVSRMDENEVRDTAPRFRELYAELLGNEEFQDLISKSVDHKSRTQRRFVLWDAEMIQKL